MKQHHHVYLSKEVRDDCEVWKVFLENATNQHICRPLIDLDSTITSEKLRFYTDASLIGMGAIFGDGWLWLQWNQHFIANEKPSIEFLELYILVAAMVTWGSLITNTRVIIFCDNTAVWDMINGDLGMTTHCPQCLKLL